MSRADAPAAPWYAARPAPVQTLHVHSRYVDGADTLAAMAEAALRAGLSSLGFSEHGYVPVPVVGEPCWMTPDETARYLMEARAAARARRAARAVRRIGAGQLWL